MLQQKARALRSGRGCDHPDKDGDKTHTHTHRVLFGSWGVRFIHSNKNVSE